MSFSTNFSLNLLLRATALNCIASFEPVLSHFFQDTKTFYFVLGLCHAIALSSSFTNPVMYGWFNTSLRSELETLLPKACRSTCLKRWVKFKLLIAKDPRNYSFQVSYRFSYCQDILNCSCINANPCFGASSLVR